VIYVCDLNVSHIDNLKEAVKNQGSDTKIIGYKLDVSSESETIALLKRIIKDFGRFDFYFANAGIVSYSDLNTLDLGKYHRTIAVLQTSIVLGLKYGSQAMAVTSESKSQSSGCFVITSSAAAMLPSWADLTYSTAKCAAVALVRSGAVYLSSSNIRVNGIAPGSTRSSLFMTSAEAEKGEPYSLSIAKDEILADYEKRKQGVERVLYHDRISDPDEMAELGVFLVSKASKAINGQVILADNGKTGAALVHNLGEIPPVLPLKVD